MIKRIGHLLPLHARLTPYNCLIIPLFDYGDTVWGDKNNDTLMGQLQVLQNKAAKAGNKVLFVYHQEVHQLKH